MHKTKNFGQLHYSYTQIFSEMTSTIRHRLRVRLQHRPKPLRPPPRPLHCNYSSKPRRRSMKYTQRSGYRLWVSILQISIMLLKSMSSFQVDDYVTSSSRFLNAAPGKGTDAVTKGKDRVADYSRKVGNFCHKPLLRVHITCPYQIVYVRTVYTLCQGWVIAVLLNGLVDTCHK